MPKKTSNQPSTSVGIQIGACAESVKEARAAIMDVLNCAAGSKEKIEALKALNQMCSVNHASISNVSIQGPL